MPKVAPYWVFFRLYEETQRRKGRRLTKDELIEEASVYWNELGPDDRCYFVERAKEETKKRRDAPWSKNNRRTEFPRPEQPPKSDATVDSLKERNLNRLRRLIQNTDGGIQCMEFTMFHVNNQYTMKSFFDAGKQPQHLRPLELAMCRFSIEKGVTDRWHSMLNPGLPRMPRTQENRAKFVCSETHRIPIKGVDEAPSDVKSVWTSAMSFCKDSLLISVEEFAEIMGALIFLLNKSGSQDVPFVMDFASFLGCVKETTEDETASAELRVQSSDLRQLESNDISMACEYHRKGGQGWRYCSLVAVTIGAEEALRRLSRILSVEVPVREGCYPVFEYTQQAAGQETNDNLPGTSSGNVVSTE